MANEVSWNYPLNSPHHASTDNDTLVYKTKAHSSASFLLTVSAHSQEVCAVTDASTRLGEGKVSSPHCKADPEATSSVVDEYWVRALKT